MKKNIFLLAVMALCVLFFGCTAENESLYNVHNTPKLVVMVYDITASTNAYTTLSEQNLNDLFKSVAFDGGGTFAAITVKSNSKEQDVLTLCIPQVDTMNMSGNVYHNNKRAEKNQKIMSQAETACQDFLSQTRSLIAQDKNERRSDVCTSLKLAKNETDFKLYQNHEKYVIIVSDLLDNVSSSHGTNSCVDFGDAQLILVRPAENQKLVTANNINIANSIDEAIRMLTLK